MKESLKCVKIADKNIPTNFWYLCIDIQVLDADFIFRPITVGDFSLSHLFFLKSVIAYHNAAGIIPYLLYNIGNASAVEIQSFKEIGARE